MTNQWEGEFRDIAERYPGSSRVRHVNRVERPVDDPDPTAWDRAPQRFKVKGVDREFFTVGALAEALGRRPGTLRKWEREGLLPRAPFRKPSDDPRGVRRLYSRDHVEAIVKIAYEEGLMGQNFNTPIEATAFTTRVKALFEELKASGNR